MKIVISNMPSLKKLSILSVLTLLMISRAVWAVDLVKISKPWARPAQIGQNGAVFLEIIGAEDKLIRAECDVCEKVELHTHLSEIVKQEDGSEIEVKKMRPIPYIEISPRKVTILKRGGLHIMLLKMKKTLKVGDEVPVKLVFEKTNPVIIQAKVKKCCGTPCH